jgi:hypothetical protein
MRRGDEEEPEIGSCPISCARRRPGNKETAA